MRCTVTNWGPKQTHFALRRLLQFLEVGLITPYICIMFDFGADLDSSASWDHPMKASSSAAEGATACSLPPKKQSFRFQRRFIH